MDDGLGSDSWSEDATEVDGVVGDLLDAALVEGMCLGSNVTPAEFGLDRVDDAGVRNDVAAAVLDGDDPTDFAPVDVQDAFSLVRWRERSSGHVRDTADSGIK